MRILKKSFGNFKIFSDEILKDPNGPELFRFQFVGAVAKIVSKLSKDLIAIDIARNLEELKLLLDIQNKFILEGFDVKAISPRVFKKRVRQKKDDEFEITQIERLETKEVDVSEDKDSRNTAVEIPSMDQNSIKVKDSEKNF